MLRDDAVDFAESLEIEVELSLDDKWLIAGPFKSKEIAETFAFYCERIGLTTKEYDGRFVKFA